jgi:hypothetical protein
MSEVNGKKIRYYSSFKKPTCGPVSSVQGSDELRYREIVLGLSPDDHV